jgi:hypothetical protein
LAVAVAVQALLVQVQMHLEIMAATEDLAVAVAVQLLHLEQQVQAVTELFIYTTKEIKWEHMQ